MRPAAPGPDLAEIAAEAVRVATWLDEHGSMFSGAVRQLAIAAAALAGAVADHRCADVGVPAAPGACRGCGAPVEQLGRGRPRRYCLMCSPRKVPGK